MRYLLIFNPLHIRILAAFYSLGFALRAKPSGEIAEKVLGKSVFQAFMKRNKSFSNPFHLQQGHETARRI